ncbi:MAG: hypothetical protein ACR2NJ_08300 [Acidimicrobiales bacterium]
MPEPDPTPTDAAAPPNELAEDTEDAAAWEALDEDRREQQQERASERPGDQQPTEAPEVVRAEPIHDVPEALEPGAGGTVNTAAAGTTQPPQPERPRPGAPTAPGRRVFVIDQKEYPDPDPDLPITGPRSVQAMYRDYFPGQLDNADVVQKTRDDGTLAVAFKRRIGTKGARRARPSAGEVAITVPRVVGVLATLPADRPLVWDLIEQAVTPSGALRLDYAPPAAQLNLAEAQQAARVRQIEQTVGELRRLRPTS